MLESYKGRITQRICVIKVPKVPHRGTLSKTTNQQRQKSQ